MNSSRDGERGKLGNLLQRENHPYKGRDNQVDKAGPNRDLGMVRDGFDACLGQPVSPHGDKQEVRVAADERRSIGNQIKSMVEVLDKQTNGADPLVASSGLLATESRASTSNRSLEKDRSRVDTTDNHKEEDTPDQADRMLNDGESSQGEIDVVCRASNQFNHAYQRFIEHNGGNQALCHLAP